jgi:hypothetical protein
LRATAATGSLPHPRPCRRSLCSCGSSGNRWASSRLASRRRPGSGAQRRKRSSWLEGVAGVRDGSLCSRARPPIRAAPVPRQDAASSRERRVKAGGHHSWHSGQCPRRQPGAPAPSAAPFPAGSVPPGFRPARGAAPPAARPPRRGPASTGSGGARSCDPGPAAQALASHGLAAGLVRWRVGALGPR